MEKYLNIYLILVNICLLIFSYFFAKLSLLTLSLISITNVVLFGIYITIYKTKRQNEQLQQKNLRLINSFAISAIISLVFTNICLYIRY